MIVNEAKNSTSTQRCRACCKHRTKQKKKGYLPTMQAIVTVKENSDEYTIITKNVPKENTAFFLGVFCLVEIRRICLSVCPDLVDFLVNDRLRQARSDIPKNTKAEHHTKNWYASRKSHRWFCLVLCLPQSNHRDSRRTFLKFIQALFKEIRGNNEPSLAVLSSLDIS